MSSDDSDSSSVLEEVAAASVPAPTAEDEDEDDDNGIILIHYVVRDDCGLGRDKESKTKELKHNENKLASRRLDEERSIFGSISIESKRRMASSLSVIRTDL